MQREENLPTLEVFYSGKPRTTHTHTPETHFVDGAKGTSSRIPPLQPTWRNLFFPRYIFSSDSSTRCLRAEAKNLHTGDYRGTNHAWLGNDLFWRQRRIRVQMTWGFPGGCQAPGFRVWINTASSWHTCVEVDTATLSHLPVASSPCWVTDFPLTAAICSKTQRRLRTVGMATKHWDCLRVKVNLS